MKLIVLLAASAVVGALLGVLLARNDVGRVDDRFYPPASGIVADSGAAAGDGASATVGAPVAKVDAEVHDFGTMQRGMTESHEFVVTNAGTEPLTLRVGQTTCKCTLGEVSSRPLAPGESAPVRLEWVAKTAPGKFEQKATVITNDPLRPRLELMVKGLVTEPAGLEPQELVMGQMSADETRTATVYLASFDPDAPPLEATAQLEDGSPLADKVQIEVESVPVEELPHENAASGVKITATAGPGLPIGHLIAWVLVQTNLPRATTDGGDNGDAASPPDGIKLQVPLYARVEGDISLRGVRWSRELGLLNLGKVSSRQGVSEKLLISFKGEHAEEARATVEGVDPEWLEVELGEPKVIRPGVTHQPMTVTIPPGRAPEIRSGPGADNGGVGEGDAVVRLRTNHPVTDELDVKVRFVIAQ